MRIPVKSFLLFIVLLLIYACNSGRRSNDVALSSVSQEKPMYIQMADSDIKRNPEGWMIDFRKEPKWEYTNGLFCTALYKVYQRTSEKKYFDYIKDFADFMIGEDGSIKTYKKSDYNIDRVNSGKFLIELYKETGENKYRLALEELRDQMRAHPRTKEGGFWHKKVYPHQMWLDGLYMGSPFLAQYAVEFNEPELFNDVANQIYLIDKYTYVKEVDFYYHGWDESREQKWADPETGLSPHVWGRSMGWFAMALIDVLDYFPEDHPKRPLIVEVTYKMAASVARSQDKESGLWWQVMDQPGREGNYLESSASSMFAYFLLKGINNGILDEQYKAVAVKAYEGILERFIRIDQDGGISLTNVCSVAGLGGNPYRDGSYEYYISEPQRDNDPKGVGPFIMAALEFEKIHAGPAKSKMIAQR